MGNERGLGPLVGNDPAVSTALNPLTGRGVWLPLFGDMVVWDLFLGNVSFANVLRAFWICHTVERDFKTV